MVHLETTTSIWLWSLLIITITLSPIYATTYYVATDGSDGYPGTELLPWEHIQHAADIMTAGDTVYIKAGTYNERIIPGNSGIADNYILYTAYPGDSVIIDGTGIFLPSDWGGLFDISDKSYIKISGLTIINAGPNDNNSGILVDNSNHIIIEKNYIYNTVSSGIGVWNSGNITINGNEVELACNDGEQECITVATTNTFIIKNNHVYNGGPGTIGGEGIDVKDGSSNGKIYKNLVHDINRLGIYVDSWDKHTYNIEVFQNIVYNCSGDGFCVVSEAGGLLEDVKIYNNIAYGNEACGLTFGHYGEPAPSRPLRNIKVINNTFYNNGDGGWGGGISVESGDADSIIIRNNILSQNLIFQIQVEVSIPTLNVDHNLIDGYRGYEDEIYGSDSVVGNALFIDAPGVDFHLQSNSPAINKGSSLEAPIFDLDSVPRPIDSNWDIGAYEYDPGGIISEGENKPQIFLINPYPNPFNSAVEISLDYGSESPQALSASAVGPCQLEIFDINGRLVYAPSPSVPLPKGEGGKTLLPPGEGGSKSRMRAFIWTPDESIGSGIYLVRAKLGDKSVTKRVVYLK